MKPWLENQLGRVPTRLEQEQTFGRIRWQMGEKDLERGSLSEWLRLVDAVFCGAKTGPYR